MTTDAREREREALEEAYRQLEELNTFAAKGHSATQFSAVRAAIRTYGRAVREADREAAQGGTGEVVAQRSNDWLQGYYDGRQDAAAAIEALEEKLI